MRDDLDDRLHDAVALDEIDLYADVLSAVAIADGPLSPAELDVVLGVAHEPSSGQSGPAAPAPRIASLRARAA
jgi:hypothetical protein